MVVVGSFGFCTISCYHAVIRLKYTLITQSTYSQVLQMSLPALLNYIGIQIIHYCRHSERCPNHLKLIG